MKKTSYYLFGFIKLWTVKHDFNKDALYEEMSVRFRKELDAAILARRN